MTENGEADRVGSFRPNPPEANPAALGMKASPVHWVRFTTEAGRYFNSHR